MNDSSPTPSQSEGRVLILESDEALLSEILGALHEAAPAAVADVARDLEDAQRRVLNDRPNLFVLDMDATQDLSHDFLLDLRTSHPDARAVILTGIHLPEHREQAAGIGAIHFLEKPFPHSDFVDLVQALLRPDSKPEGEKFQGTLSDLHLSDIIQLKCMSGATSTLEFTGPAGEKARVYFENGQVTHAVAPGREGVQAFNEIVSWKGGKIAELPGTEKPARTIDLDWQFLLMEAVRKTDETSARREHRKQTAPVQQHKILVIDDSPMLVTFVQEILAEANYDVVTAGTAQDGLEAVRRHKPDLILLDYMLPDFRGDEVSRRLAGHRRHRRIPVLYMSGFGADLAAAQARSPNVLGIVNKPFTSDLLLKTVEQHLPKSGMEESEEPQVEPEPAPAPEFTDSAGSQTTPADSPWIEDPDDQAGRSVFGDFTGFSPSAASQDFSPSGTDLPFFSGETTFFPLTLALRTIGREALTGVLRCDWAKQSIELYVRDGKFIIVTTRDPQLYCPEAPVALANIDSDRITEARNIQAQNGCPFFMTLVSEDLILRDPAMQLVQHYGQKLFAQLWGADRTRFVFHKLGALPDFTENVPTADDVDHWILETLRFVQAQDVTDKLTYNDSWIPAYTRDGFERVQSLRLTVAEAQFASQFNGSRSIAQIARNLRLDLRSARLNLFRFIALEIVECWPPAAQEQEERGGMFRRLGRSIGGRK